MEGSDGCAELVVGDTLLFLMFVQNVGLEVVLLFVFRFLFPYLVNRVKFLCGKSLNV